MNDRRKVLIVALGVVLLAAPSGAKAQQARKVSRVGMLLTGSRSDADPMTAAFRRGLGDLGYVEGQNIAVEPRWAESVQGLADLATELVRGKVDIIVTQGTPAAQAAKPIAILLNPTNPAHRFAASTRESAAKTLGVALQVLEARGPDDFERVFHAAMSGRAGALIVLSDPVATAHLTRIANLAARSRLPTIYGLSGFAEAGGLANYGPSLPEMFRRAAIFVDKILKGAKPADLPVEQPTKFELIINLKTAKALGLTIPQSVLLRAEQVIE